MDMIILRRSDFKDPTAEVNYFDDYVLDSFRVPREKHAEIDSIELWVTKFETSDI